MNSGLNAAALIGYRARMLPGDLTGGLATAIVAVPHCLPLGIIAFAPLGPAYAGMGATAGMVSSVIAGIVVALFGSSRILVGGPRVSSALLMAATLSFLVADPALQIGGAPDVPRILAMLFLYIVLAGAMQVGFGLVKLGAAIKYIPYPVIAGFMNGIALLIIMGQYEYVLGLPHGYTWHGFSAFLSDAQPGALAVAVVTVLAVVVCQRLVPRLPILIIGVVTGSLLYYGLVGLDGGLRLGGVVGAMPHGFPKPEHAAAILGLLVDPATWKMIFRLLPAIAVLALMASVESLISALGADALSGDKHDSNSELIGQGLGNIACGFFGAVPSAGATTRSVANYQAGGRTPLSSIVHALILLAILVLGGGVFGQIPQAVLGGAMVFLAWSMFEDWSRQLFVKFARVWRGNWRGDMVANLTVVLLVFGVTVLVNPVVAVGLGVLASMILFVRSMSKSIIRRVTRGDARRSLRVREEDQAVFLAAQGNGIVVAELDGPLFFGTGDQLSAWADALADDVRYMILDFRRVSDVDATGARMLSQLARHFQARGGTVALAHINSGADTAIFHEMGVDKIVPPARWFGDSDHALEWAENALLEGQFGEEANEGISLKDLPILAGCSDAVVDAVASKLERRELQAGETLFEEGDSGTELYFVVAGRIDIVLRLDNDTERMRRLSTVGPGAIIGEMALFAGRPRSADAIAVRPASLYALSEASFRILLAEEPEAATRLLLNIGRELSIRLAVTNQELRLVES